MSTLIRIMFVDYFEVDDQTTFPEGYLVKGKRTVKLHFHACQRRMCFNVTLRDGISRPALGQRYAFNIAKTFYRNIVLNPVEGFIESCK